jgi:hypothetical protein
MTNENDSNSPSPNPQNEPPRQPPVFPPAPARGEVSPDPTNSANNQQETAQELAREFRWVEVASLIVNGALAVIGVVALCIYYGQLKEMRKATSASQQSADAATEAAKSTEEAAKETRRAVDVAVEADRPWIGSEGVDITHEAKTDFVRAKIRFGNGGKSPARVTWVKFSGHVYAKFPEKPDYTPPKNNPWNENSRFIMVPGKWSSSTPTLTINPADGPDLDSGKKKIYFYGIVKYQDMRTGEPHMAKMCWFYSGDPVGSLCPEYNDAD